MQSTWFRIIPAVFLAFPIFLWGSFTGWADQNSPELIKLFARLHTISDASEIKNTELKIWAIWTKSEREEVNLLMQKGIASMERQDYSNALQIFDKIVEIAPKFAEGWNKRATVHYLLKNYESSITDIKNTLLLEPRHFGAISGLGLVYLAQEQYYQALKAYQKALEVHPSLLGAKYNILVIRKYLNKKTI
ncbi:MAG: tetratricopeptide repeat protein [SAR324 cluster bacterium]|nr:tetratricopeptide repeat protein [SAR324 cluster bacterium]